MTKSVYSIVLSDDVVAAIDKMAYSLGTNRSGLINQILAEKVSYITPEQRVKHIIDMVLDNINDSLTFQSLSNSTNLMLKSAVKYKYNPTVKYAVTLTPNRDILGELRVTLRTQNSALLEELDKFLHRWTKWEKKYISDKLPHTVKYSIREGRFDREFAMAKSIKTDDDAAAAVWDYINIFDAALKQYFHSGGKNDEKTYAETVKKCRHVI